MDERTEQDIALLLKNPQTRKKAFEMAVTAFSEPLYWQIRRMVLSHDDANDLLQNTFMKAWTNLESFRGDSRLSTWLFKIATNECLTFLNRQKLTQGISLDDIDVTLLNKLESPSDFEGEEAQKKLEKAVLTLPDKQRLVFNMKYFQEMKYEDMSAILGTTVGALKASYHIAVKKNEDLLFESN